jgi:hypothetical protein
MPTCDRLALFKREYRKLTPEQGKLALGRLTGSSALTAMRRSLQRPATESEGPATTMTRTMEERKSSQWTPEEIAREERARAVRARQDRAKTPAERLEETLRLSRLMSELQRDAASDVPSR